LPIFKPILPGNETRTFLRYTQRHFEYSAATYPEKKILHIVKCAKV